MDERIKKLSALLVNYSTRIQPGEKVLIESRGTAPLDLVKALVRDVYAAGGEPFVNIVDSGVKREILMGASMEQLKLQADAELALMKNMQAYIGISGPDNSAELSDVPSDKLSINNLAGSELLDYRVGKTKWVVLRYPNPAMAQMAGMSTAAFEDFYYDVCTMDYARMNRAMDALKARMDRADEVRITGPGTDISFSVKGLGAVKCAGDCNIPDGEVFTAPVRESVNGKIAYNTPSLYQGFTYENICFEVEKGKIVKAAANDSERLNGILDTDEGARYFGEFAIGVNPYVLSPMKDTLFDEKICGSFHFTPGRAYDDCDNGNRSAVHWDLVMIQRPEYGGGELWFDGELIRKDGLFVPEDLHCLNPESLK